MEVTEDSREEFIHDQLIETSNDNPFRGSYQGILKIRFLLWFRF